MSRCNVLATLLALCIVGVLGQHKHQHLHQHRHYARQTTKSNVLVIMTDDQGMSILSAAKHGGLTSNRSTSQLVVSNAECAEVSSPEYEPNCETNSVSRMA
jgi:hypothetical protein